MKATLVLTMLLAVTAHAEKFEIKGSVYQNQSGQQIFVEKSKERIQMCIDICFQSYDRPSAELKACVTKCAN